MAPENNDALSPSTPSPSSPSLPLKTPWLGWLCFHVLGVAMLFPWNAFINANGYFSSRLASSPYASWFNNAFSLSFMLANTLGLMCSIFLPTSYATHRRILWNLAINAFVLFACTCFTMVALTPGLCFFIHLFLILTCGLSIAFLQNGVFALLAHFPPGCTQAVMSGQGLAAAAVSIVDEDGA